MIVRYFLYFFGMRNFIKILIMYIKLYRCLSFFTYIATKISHFAIFKIQIFWHSHDFCRFLVNLSELNLANNMNNKCFETSYIFFWIRNFIKILIMYTKLCRCLSFFTYIATNILQFCHFQDSIILIFSWFCSFPVDFQ